jgi:hypothetical protein
MILKSTILIILLFILFICCSNKNRTEKVKELLPEEKRLELSQKDLTSINNIADTGKAKIKNTHGQKKKKRELRYLFFANGGVIGYFNDGTVVGCAKCDFCRSNILQMFKEKPFQKYIVESDGSLLIDGVEKIIPVFNNTQFDEWALIDYKWYIKPPQY